MSGDVHAPTHAGPSSGDFGTSAGAAGVTAEPTDKPEILAGAAFAGGLAAALILKRLFVRD
jgi:hypothetical protein